jgi:hypothetical protein
MNIKENVESFFIYLLGILCFAGLPIIVVFVYVAIPVGVVAGILYAVLKLLSMFGLI